jgi:hypothetical protein
LKKVCWQNKQERRKRTSLPNSPFAVKNFPTHTIEKDRGGSIVHYHFHPELPFCTESLVS